MATTLHLAGIDELLEALEALVPELMAQTRPLELTTAEETAEALRAAYPVVTGRLRNGVRVDLLASSSPARAAAQVVSSAPYAGYYEFGTRRTGPHPTFVPITRRGREAFVEAVIETVEAQGLEVSGDTGS